MPDTGNTFAKPVPLLPVDKAQDRPLFMVLAILAFLATLALLGIKTGLMRVQNGHRNSHIQPVFRSSQNPAMISRHWLKKPGRCY